MASPASPPSPPAPARLCLDSAESDGITSVNNLAKQLILKIHVKGGNLGMRVVSLLVWLVAVGDCWHWLIGWAGWRITGRIHLFAERGWEHRASSHHRRHPRDVNGCLYIVVMHRISACRRAVGAPRNWQRIPYRPVSTNSDENNWWTLVSPPSMSTVLAGVLLAHGCLSPTQSSLHKRVAHAITSTLTNENQSEIHKSLSSKLREADSHRSHSIDEAIVSAQAREAHHQSSKKVGEESVANATRQQQQLEKEIEERAIKKAEERHKLELALVEEKLRRAAEAEKERIQKLDLEHKRELKFAKWKEDVSREKKEKGSTDQETSDPALDDHPILGRQIAHLQTKRLYLTRASTLASLPVYEKQRAYRHERAKVMAKDKKSSLWMGVPGVISLAEEEDGRLSILDGQHRVGMMAILAEEQRRLENRKSEETNDNAQDDELLRLDLDNIVVEVFTSRQSGDADSVLGERKNDDRDDKAIIFTEINKAQPIKLLDLPGVTDKKTRDVIDYASDHFADAFPAMFSASQRCRAPNLNHDNLREALFASEVLKREKIGSGGELVKWMNGKNDELRERYGKGVELQDGERRISQGALKKARKHDLYLGLDSTWLYK